VYIGEGEHIFFIEYKREKGHLKGIQRAVHDALRKRGFRVYVCWNLKQAENAFIKEQALQAERLSAPSD
jgi:hypothetical protein